MEKKLSLICVLLIVITSIYTQNVGIGTSTPQNKLEVSGSFGIKRSETGAAIWFNSGVDQNHVLWNDYYGGPITKGASGSGFDGIKWNTFKGIHFRTGTAGATERLIISDDDNYINLLNSNVGIGNNTPRVKLSLGESIPTGHQYVYLRVYGDEPGSWKGGGAFGFTSASVIIGELGGVAQIGGHANDLNAWANIAINSGGGNVGIGTSDPQAKLHVNGGVRLSSLASSNRLIYANASGDLAVSSSDINPNNLIDGSGTLNYIPKWTPDGNTVGNSQIFDNGTNVGLGTTSPSRKLDVIGDIRSTGNNFINNTSPTIYLQDSDHRSGMIHMNSNLLYFLSGNGTNSTTWATNGALWPLTINMTNDVATFGGEAHFMEGNVGIATATPVRRLDVAGSQRIRQTGSIGVGNNSQLEISNAGTGAAFLSFHREGVYGAHFGLDVDNWFSTQGWSAGTGYTNLRTGIVNAIGGYQYNGVPVIFNSGTDVYGNFRVIQSNSTLNDGMYLNYNSTGGTAAHLRFFANGTNERMRILATNGNVGIGTTTPVRQLEVNNAMKFTNSSADANDGVLGAGTFAPGLNLVGINTDNTFRKVSIWGEITQQQNGGTNVWQGQNRYTALAGTGEQRLVRTSSNGTVVADLQYVYANIDSDGFVQSESRGLPSGFGSVNIRATGIFRVTFSNPFIGRPVCTCSQLFPASGSNWFTDLGNGGSTLDNAILVGVTNTWVDVKTGDGSGNAANRSFSLQCIGAR